MGLGCHGGCLYLVPWLLRNGEAMKRTRIFQRNVEQRDYHSLCKCGQPITLYVAVSA